MTEKDNKFSFLEPYGHENTKSKFERYWDRFAGPFSLHRERVAQFSVYAGMTHFPLKYTMRRFTLDKKKPGKCWIINNLLSFVKTEFSEEKKSSLEFPYEWKPEIKKIFELPDYFLDTFLESSEWANRIEIKRPKNETPKEVAKSLFHLLCDPKIGSNKNYKHNNQEEFINRIVPAIKDRSRLLFVIPGFPFKDQNRFRVPFDASMPDFGEISFMIRLYNLTQTMYQVHPFGVDVVVLSDGDLYQKIFGLSPDRVSEYMGRLIHYRNKLNLQGAVSFLSLKELIDRSGDSSEAWNIAKYIKSELRNTLGSDDDKFNSVFNTLVSGMKWNYNTKTFLTELDDKACWQVVRREKKDVEKKYHKYWDKLHFLAIEAALEYASINLMLRWTKLITKFFPDAIRGTVHPKPGQFALAGAKGSFSWNGVAYSKSWPKNIDDIRIVPYISLSEYSSIYEVKFKNSNMPAFFTSSALNKNIEAARNVLNKDGWRLDEIHGRELIISDLDDFIDRGLGDKNFSWERKLQTESYFTGLFQFRMSHYKRHGFGVHGLWIDGKLAGQCGLQVLEEDLDEIEFVIFLGKEFTKLGFGTKLFSYMIERCKVVGMKCLYGVVRPGNVAGIKFIKKFNSQEIRTIKHFNQEGILHRIDL